MEIKREFRANLMNCASHSICHSLAIHSHQQHATQTAQRPILSRLTETIYKTIKCVTLCWLHTTTLAMHLPAPLISYGTLARWFSRKLNTDISGTKSD